MSQQPYSPGLENVVAGETAICEVTQTSLRYRGYEIAELAEHASFDEVAHLLLHGALPTAEELKDFRRRVQAAMALPNEVVQVVRSVPRGAPPMDVMRTAVSMLGHFDPDAQDNSRDAEVRKSERLLGQLAAVLGQWQQHVHNVSPYLVDAEATHGGNLLGLILGRRPEALPARVLDGTLILYAEHDFNASTFTARVIASTLSDLHGAVAGAIAALKGPLHGGANEAAMQMFLEIGSVENVEPWFRAALAAKKKIMGFGHRVYKHGDHRAAILREWSVRLTKLTGQTKWIAIADKLQELMLKEKNIHPNTDYPAAHAYYQMGIPIPLYTPIFVCSRVTGWCAHIIEQHGANRLYRPISVYSGPGARKMTEIEKRA
ncbi:MAG: citrate synthase [Phycisphaerae bacterium]|nr:citrate synthase [Phycisphaerae bacterium]NUQ45190.1 citrate synthase [Phycisphaerae bacterium]